MVPKEIPLYIYIWVFFFLWFVTIKRWSFQHTLPEISGGVKPATSVLEILLAVSIPKSVGSTPVWVGDGWLKPACSDYSTYYLLQLITFHYSSLFLLHSCTRFFSCVATQVCPRSQATSSEREQPRQPFAGGIQRKLVHEEFIHR